MSEAAPEPVSVVICAYTEDRWDDLCAAVESVFNQTIRPLETILIIDHNDELLRRAQAEFPVRVLPNRYERGLSGGRNTAIEEAKGSVLAFLDDDAAARPNWLEVLQAGYRQDGVLGVGGAAYPVWPGQRPRWLSSEFYWVVGCSYSGQPESPEPVRNFLGCNMSFRRELFDLVEPFTVGIGRVGTRPVGCEETELCIRILAAKPGGILLYDPAMAVDHRVTQNRLTWGYFFRRCYAEGLSKALVAARVGSEHALSTERRYVLRTLPRGLLRAVADTTKGDRSASSRGLNIIAGVATTGAGYAVGKALGRVKAIPAGAAWRAFPRSSVRATAHR